MRILASLPWRAALATGLVAGTAVLSGCIAPAGGGIHRGPPLQVHGPYVRHAEPPRVVILPGPGVYRVVPDAHGPWAGIGRPGRDWRDRGWRDRGWRDRDWRGRDGFGPGIGVGRFHRAPGWGPGWPAARSPLRDNGRCDDRRYETSNGGRAAPGADEYDCSRFGGGLKGRYR